MRIRCIFSCGLIIFMGLFTACGGGGGGSNPIPVNDGPNVAPSSFYAAFNFNEIDLTWSPSIPVGIEGLRIYRASYNLSGTLGTYIKMAELPVSALAYNDVQLQEQIKYNYRLCFVKNNIEGPYANVDSRWIGLLPPIKLVTTAGTNQATLTWTNVSVHATNIVVNRKFSDGALGGNWIKYATIPATATSFVDNNLLSGFYTYQLTSIAGSDLSSGPEANVWVLDSENPFHLTSQIINAPSNGVRWWTRNAVGNWFMLDELGIVYIPTGQQSWNQILLPNSITGYAQPGIRLDTSGFPHIIYYTRTGSDAQPMIITHAWYDGVTWKSEEIARRTLLRVTGISIIGFDVADSGAIHAFWNLGDGALGNHIEYATNESGRWNFSSIISSKINLASSSVHLVSIKISKDGTIYLCAPIAAIGIGEQILVYSRQYGQSWNEELVPLAPNQIAAGYNPVTLLPVNSGGFDLLYYNNESNNIFEDVMCLSKRQGLWGQPDLIVSRGFSGNAPKLWGATTKDGTRTVVGVDMPAPGYLQNNLESSMLLFTRDSNNLWTRTTLTNSGRSESEVNYLLDFDNFNHFYALNTVALAFFLEH